jgi:hypothetical protein
MQRRRIQLGAALAVLALVALGGAALVFDGGTTATAKPVRLAAATMIVEVNATDGDAGLQVFLDGEPWRSIMVSDPNGSRILTFGTEGRVRDFGLTELFSESSEPPFAEFPLEEFKALFPEGTYTFAGTTVEGRRAVGTARLTHEIPDGPKILAPEDGAAVSRDAVVARWAPVTTPAGIDVVGYRAIVTREDPLRVFSADLTASARRLAIPPEFLEADTEYKLEVQAIEKGGNQTLTEVSFVVE